LPNITAPRFPGNLQNGSRGDNVQVLQQNLNDLVPFYPSIPRLNADGVFGPITQSSVVAFQRIFGMSQSGVANQTTWNLIMSMRNLLTQGLAARVFEEFLDFDDELLVDEVEDVFAVDAGAEDSSVQHTDDFYDEYSSFTPTVYEHEKLAPVNHGPDMFMLLLAMYLMRRFR